LRLADAFDLMTGGLRARLRRRGAGLSDARLPDALAVCSVALPVTLLAALAVNYLWNLLPALDFYGVRPQPGRPGTAANGREHRHSRCGALATQTLTVTPEAAMAAFPPITHVAVTVTDLERSTRWYGELLAAEPVLDEDEQAGGFHHTVFALGGGQLLGLHTHPQAAGGTFDEHRTGLDHLAFACRDRDELRAWAARLDELGIVHGGIKDAHYGSGVSFRDPDGIALEFFAPPA
jgi:glyoxylase I family protein